MNVSQKQTKTVDEYMGEFPQSTQKILKKMRKIILQLIPGAHETIKYGIPTFMLNGKNVVHVAAYAHHIGFYPTPSAIIHFKKELVSYTQAKGSVQFPIDKPIPFDIIKKMVLFRVEEVRKG